MWQRLSHVEEVLLPAFALFLHLQIRKKLKLRADPREGKWRGSPKENLLLKPDLPLPVTCIILTHYTSFIDKKDSYEEGLLQKYQYNSPADNFFLSKFDCKLLLK